MHYYEMEKKICNYLIKNTFEKYINFQENSITINLLQKLSNRKYIFIYLIYIKIYIYIFNLYKNKFYLIKGKSYTDDSL